jgi:hypothetical protein
MIYPTIFFFVRDGVKHNRYQLENRDGKLYLGCLPGARENVVDLCFDMKHIDIQSLIYQDILNIIENDADIFHNSIVKHVISALVYYIMYHKDETTLSFDIKKAKLWNGYKYYMIKNDKDDVAATEIGWESILEDNIDYITLLDGFFMK